jgi:hypothetical protein
MLDVLVMALLCTTMRIYDNLLDISTNNDLM